MCICVLLCEACEHESRRGRQMSWGRSCKGLRQRCRFGLFHLFAYYSYASIRDLSVSLPFAPSVLFSLPLSFLLIKFWMFNLFPLCSFYILAWGFVSIGVYIDISLGQVRSALKSPWVLSIHFASWWVVLFWCLSVHISASFPFLSLAAYLF